MDLESRVKAYAEEARRVLLQRALEEKEQKNGKAFWQGYTTNGNGIVKQDGIYKVVQVIGNVSVPKNTVVYIDEQNTVQVGFKRESPLAKVYGKEQLKPTIADKIKRPLLIFTDDIFGVGDFILSYGYLRLDAGIPNNYAEMYDDITGNLVGSDSSTLANVTNTYSSKSTYYFGGAGAGCFTNGSVLGGITYTSSVELTGTPWDFSISATVDTFSQDTEYYATTAFGVLGSDITAEIDYQAEGAYGGGGSIEYEVDFSYFTPPETEFYLQHGSLGPDADDPIYKRLDLQSYFSDTIVAYELLHDYTKKTATGNDSTSSQTFLIFYVQTVDFSYNQVFTTAPPGRDNAPWEARLVGALKHWYLHIKINNDDNSVDYKATLQTKMTSGANYATLITEFDDAWHGDNVFARIETYRNNTFGSRYQVTVDVDSRDSLYWLVRYPHLQDILSEAYEGDWLYEWRNVIVPDMGGSNVPPDFYDRFFDFLKYHFYEGVWYDYLNSGELREPPYIGSSVGSWQPGSQYQNDYGIGIPPDTTAYSINNLVITMENFATYTSYSNYFDGSVQGVPDVYDEWVTGTYGPQPPFTSVISNQERPWFTYVQTIPLQP